MIGIFRISVIGPEKLIKEFGDMLQSELFDWKFDSFSFGEDITNYEEAIEEGEIPETKSRKIINREGLYG